MEILARFINHLRSADVAILFDVATNTAQSASELQLAGFPGRIISFEPSIGANIGLVSKDIARLDDYIGQRFGNVVPQFALRIDKQGFERGVLAGLTRHLGKCVAILIKLPLSPVLNGAASLPAAFSQLSQLGYRCVGLSDDCHHPQTGNAIGVDAFFVRNIADARDIFPLYTSIPPSLSGESLEKQRKVIATWRAAGFEPISLNGASEIKAVVNLGLDVEVRELATNGKPLIGEMLQIICRQSTGVAGLINADCAIIQYPVLAKRIAEATLPDGMMFAQRVDYQNDKILFNSSCWGFDAFFFDVAKAQDISDARYKMGECWWDYWFPMAFAAKGGRLSKIKYPVLLHEFHQTKWSHRNYLKYGNYFWDDFRKVEIGSMPEKLLALADLPRSEESVGRLAMQTFRWLDQIHEFDLPNLLPEELKSFEQLLHVNRLVTAAPPALAEPGEPAAPIKTKYKRPKPIWRQKLRRLRKAFKSSLGFD